MKVLYLFLPVLIGMVSCVSTQPQSDIVTTIPEQSSQAAPQQTKETVTAESVSRTSKGLIVTEHDVPVFSLLSSVILELNVHEGDRVKKGQTLVRLDSKEMENQVNIAQSQLDQAYFQYQTILVGQGFTIEEEHKVSEKVRKAARVRSSLDLFGNQLNSAKLHLSYCDIKAPISGVVTDISAFQYDLAEEGTALFHIIDMDNLAVKFSILESELRHISVGKKVIVCPIAYPGKEYVAEVVSISPNVDASGMIRIKAHMLDTSGIMVGMSTFVTF